MNKHLLIYQLRDELLDTLAGVSGQHFQGLASAARGTDSLSPGCRSQLIKVDFAYNLVRHITKESVYLFQKEVNEDLDGRGKWRRTLPVRAEVPLHGVGLVRDDRVLQDMPARPESCLRASAPVFAPAEAHVDLPSIPAFPHLASKCVDDGSSSFERDRVLDHQAQLIDNQNRTIGMILNSKLGKGKQPRGGQDADHDVRVAPPMEDPTQANKGRSQEALATAEQTIIDLRHQAAAQSARMARLTELQDNGRLLRSVHIPAGAPADNYTYADLFLRHAGSSSTLQLSEPYLISGFQLNNLRFLCAELASKTHIRKILITTHERSKCQAEALHKLAQEAGAHNITTTLSYVQDLHIREMQFSNGITVTCDRGLDLYKPLAAGGLCCRSATVHVFEISVQYLADQSDAVALVVEKASVVLQDDVVKEARMISDYLHKMQDDVVKEARMIAAPLEEAESMRKTRLELYEAQLMHLAHKTHRPVSQYVPPASGGSRHPRDGLHAVVHSAMWCDKYDKSCYDCPCKGDCGDLQKFTYKLSELLVECTRYRMIRRVN